MSGLVSRAQQSGGHSPGERDQGRDDFGLAEGGSQACGSDRSPPVGQLPSDACATRCPVDVCGSQGRKGRHPEEAERGTFWRGTIIDIDTRLRVGRAIEKDEKGVAAALMAQLKARGHPDGPPAIATDGQGSYREAMVETWGQVPDYAGRGRPPTRKQASLDWH